MYGKSEIMILFFNKLETADIIEYFVVLNHYLKNKNEISKVFGLLVSDSMKVIRKKIKDEIIENFAEEDLGRIFSGTNHEVYYSTTSDLDHLLAIEIRFEKNIESWYKKEKEYLILLREIGDQKKKIFSKHEK